ncbi:hypothetical protein D3C72_1409400 [compost metagenome]
MAPSSKMFQAAISSSDHSAPSGIRVRWYHSAIGVTGQAPARQRRISQASTSIMAQAGK